MAPRGPGEPLLSFKKLSRGFKCPREALRRHQKAQKRLQEAFKRLQEAHERLQEGTTRLRTGFRRPTGGPKRLQEAHNRLDEGTKRLAEKIKMFPRAFQCPYILNLLSHAPPRTRFPFLAKTGLCEMLKHIKKTLCFLQCLAS